MNNKINYKIDNCTTDLDTLIALDKRAIRDLENNTHEIEQHEVLTIIREFIRLRNDYKQEKEKNKELEEHQRQYLDGELITAKQGKFFEKMIKENYISKDKIKEIVDECIEKKANIITGEEEYCFNTNDNSFLAHKIVELLKGK